MKGGEGGGTSYGTHYNCTIVSNSVSGSGCQGGGAYGGSLHNSIVYGNLATNLPNEVNRSVWTYTCCVGEDPLFVDGDYRLSAESPCVNAGSNSYVKDAVDLPIVMHTHSTTGLAFMTYLKAIEAGADVIDTAISPFSGGTSQPATETLDYTLREMGYKTGLNGDALLKMADFFKPVRAEALEEGNLNPISLSTDTQCLSYQIPGGMLSNLLSQLKSLNALDKFDEALLETPRVRADMGYPPLVTPTSQLIGTQAVQNVLAGERYKNVGAELKAYCRGEYGKTPAPINKEVQAKILGDEKPLTGRYADTLPKDIFEKAQAELGDTARCEEDVLSYISFPPVAEKFFAARKEQEEKKVKYSIVSVD